MSMEGDALTLLLRLAKHESGIDMLNSIGSIEYLSRLRGTLGAEYRGQIDTIIEKLLHLPGQMINSQSESQIERTFSSHAETLVSASDRFHETVIKTLDQPIDVSTAPNWSNDSSATSYFPDVLLSANDEQMLDSVFAQLHGLELDLLMKSCFFLRDVLFADFPPEVFLQRPRIIQALIKLISKPTSDILAKLC
eukprot:m.243094 g.243094  ORF g.243094 m.243094 type:complete len:194 (+) comp40234_c0_seq1:183-764(+)